MKRITSIKRGLLGRLGIIEQVGSTKRLSELSWSIVVILMLGFGIWAGHSVTQAIADTELMDARAALETANASLAEANIELAFWKNTLRSLADGKQIEGVDLKGRPSTED